MTPSGRIPRVLSIAGSDSGGGAGIQADLKAFAAAGVHGMTAITAITAQNTVEVTAVHHVPPEVILAQVRAVSSDIGVDAVKIGMLGRSATIAAVAEALDELPAATPVVLDPVMVAESGAPLLDDDARATLAELLLPRAGVITPNVPEARALLGDVPGDHARRGGVPGDHARRGDVPEDHARRRGAGPASAADEEIAALARRLHGLGPAAVLITGGHREEATDVLFDGATVTQIPGERHPGGAAHGSGCTHSSLLAARLAAGDGLLEAARTAKAMAARAVAAGLRDIGSGPGPVNVLGLGQAGERAISAS